MVELFPAPAIEQISQNTCSMGPAFSSQFSSQSSSRTVSQKRPAILCIDVLSWVTVYRNNPYDMEEVNEIKRATESIAEAEFKKSDKLFV